MYYFKNIDRQQGEGQMGMDPMEIDQMGMMDGMGMGMLRSDMFLINDITEAVIREAHAYNFYQRLAELAPNDEYQRTILRIQRDEARHYHWFTMMLNMMGAQQPQIPPGDLPTGFIEGVRTAIRHELDDTAFYQNIAYRATTPHVQMHFLHASHDEQRHASWFQYMLMNL
ncbi:MAG: ferritin family protein [Eubacteriales bacterium]|nr:ferritin family protein [Eubacteriales bacterium]MDD3200332.1 ferritin family protein [Eubacteriales bacterium]MDD4630589.1 ferritin family protein [Eubacteriales bacterium]